MKIKTDIRTISGVHNGLPFILEDGILKINSMNLSQKEVRSIAEIAYLLKAEGLEIRASLPKLRAADWSPSFIQDFRCHDEPEEEKS